MLSSFIHTSLVPGLLRPVQRMPPDPLLPLNATSSSGSAPGRPAANAAAALLFVPAEVALPSV